MSDRADDHTPVERLRAVLETQASPTIDRGDSHGARGQKGWIVWESSLPLVAAALAAAPPALPSTIDDEVLKRRVTDIILDCSEDGKDHRVAAREVLTEVGKAIDALRRDNEHWQQRYENSLAAPPSIQWRCFHCDEVFTTRESAREHFGADEIAQTACQIDIAEYRRLEDQQAACRAECCEEAKRYHATEADHRRALIAEEQRGYDRGVADARKEADRSSGISWSGFNVHGDRKSIDAVTAALHSQDIEPQLRAEIVASRARSIPEREKVLEALRRALAYVEFSIDETDREECAEAKHDKSLIDIAIAALEGK